MTQEHFPSSIQAFGSRSTGGFGWCSASEWEFKGTSGGRWEFVLCSAELWLSHGRAQAGGMELLWISQQGSRALTEM